MDHQHSARRIMSSSAFPDIALAEAGRPAKTHVELDAPEQASSDFNDRNFPPSSSSSVATVYGYTPGTGVSATHSNSLLNVFETSLWHPTMASAGNLSTEVESPRSPCDPIYFSVPSNGIDYPSSATAVLEPSTSTAEEACRAAARSFIDAFLRWEATR